ncbi:MAG: hypothetical protein WBP93_05825, partial [Pyrinomonadaceae bacterium]
MSAKVEAMPAEKTKEGLPWAQWLRQTGAIMRLEIKKNFLSRRSFLIYLLALMPVLLLALLAIFGTSETNTMRVLDAQGNVVSEQVTTGPGPFAGGEANIVFAVIYGALILRTVIFFGCAWIFMNLFRGEVVDRSLHYYFLSPVKREVLVAGKYLSGLVTAAILFSATTILCLFFLYFGLGSAAASQYLFNGPGLTQALTYEGITLLACLGYGAVFLAIGLFFRNPIIPALLIYGWEWLNFLLPPLLKKVSVIHYLHSLAPVPPPDGPFAIVAEPTPAWLSIPGLLIFTALVLLLASYRIRRMEIRYG